MTLTRRTLMAAATAAPLSYLTLGKARGATPAGIAVIAQQIDDIVSFDPAESYEFSDNEVNGNCYRKLVGPDLNNPARIIGDLAENWEVSKDGLTFTFHLHDDAHFDTGKPVTAQDAEFSLRRVVVLNKTPGFIITQFGFTKDNVAQLIRATDDRTLVVTLPSVQATSFVLYCLSANVAAVVEKAAVVAHQVGDDLGNGWLKTNTAGAGPYRLVSWTASDHVIVQANPHFGQDLPIKRVVLRHIADPGAQFLALQKGDVDVARNLSSDQLKSIAGNADYHVLATPQASSMYIAMNQAMPELTKPDVQQAIKWAIGYDAIAQNITPLIWTVGQSFLPAGLPGALSEQPFKKDPGKAKQLLAQAGLPNGFSVTMDYVSSSPYAEVAEAIQQDLSEIGIKVQLLPGEQKQVITKTRARTHQLAILVWGSDYFDPNSNAQAFCANPDDSDTSKLKIIAWRSHFVDKTLTQEAADAAKELDNAKRIALYQTMQRQFWERAPFAFVLQKNAVAVLRKGVTGLYVGAVSDYTRYAQIRKS